MANYILRALLGKDTVLNKQDKEKVKKVVDSGCGDYDYDSTPFATSNDSLMSATKYVNIPPEKYFHKQAQNINTLVKSLEQEISESKEDIRYLHSHICSTEEVFPKRWEMCNSLENICKEHVENISMEMIKWKRVSERSDIEMKELGQKISSWQCVIGRAKEVQIQEEDFFE
ncbi:hypothetical protein D910_02943 [Dendroctonus ponderosae]